MSKLNKRINTAQVMKTIPENLREQIENYNKFLGQILKIYSDVQKYDDKLRGILRSYDNDLSYMASYESILSHDNGMKFPFTSIKTKMRNFKKYPYQLDTLINSNEKLVKFANSFDQEQICKIYNNLMVDLTEYILNKKTRELRHFQDSLMGTFDEAMEILQCAIDDDARAREALEIFENGDKEILNCFVNFVNILSNEKFEQALKKQNNLLVEMNDFSINLDDRINKILLKNGKDYKQSKQEILKLKKDYTNIYDNLKIENKCLSVLDDNIEVLSRAILEVYNPETNKFEEPEGNKELDAEFVKKHIQTKKAKENFDSAKVIYLDDMKKITTRLESLDGEIKVQHNAMVKDIMDIALNQQENPNGSTLN